MCGRYTLTSTPDQIIAAFGLGGISDLSPRYNIAPTQNVAAVRFAENEAKRELVFLRWGLIPSWAKDEKIGNRMINARGETVAAKPSFRHAFKKQRCLIVADGFYEWKKLSGKKKQPYLIHAKNKEPFAFAGLWESWRSGDGELESCTIITTNANGMMETLHDRMPVILNRDDYETWLDPDFREADALEKLLAPCPDDFLEAYAVSTLVNSPRNETAECLEPLPDAD